VGPTGPDELAASLKITAGGDLDRPPAVDVYGAMLGTWADASELVEGLVSRVGSDATSAALTPMTYPQTRKFWAELGDADGRAGEPLITKPTEEVWLYSKSEFFGRPLPGEAVGALLDAFVEGRTSGESRELDFMPWGGAYNRPPDRGRRSVPGALVGCSRTSPTPSWSTGRPPTTAPTTTG
jgi:hypothetical protein